MTFLWMNHHNSNKREKIRKMRKESEIIFNQSIDREAVPWIIMNEQKSPIHKRSVQQLIKEIYKDKKLPFPEFQKSSWNMMKLVHENFVVLCTTWRRGRRILSKQTTSPINIVMCNCACTIHTMNLEQYYLCLMFFYLL